MKKHPLMPWNLRTMVQSRERDLVSITAAFHDERLARLAAEERGEEHTVDFTRAINEERLARNTADEKVKQLTADLTITKELHASCSDQLQTEQDKNAELQRRIGQMQEDVARAVLCLSDMRGTGKHKRQLPMLVRMAVRRLMPVLPGAPLVYTKEEQATMAELRGD